MKTKVEIEAKLNQHLNEQYNRDNAYREGFNDGVIGVLRWALAESEEVKDEN